MQSPGQKRYFEPSVARGTPACVLSISEAMLISLLRRLPKLVHDYDKMVAGRSGTTAGGDRSMSNALRSPASEGLESLLWRLMPARSAPFLNALAVTAIALATAIGLRVAVLGFPAGLGASSTFFPAFIAITLYAGGRWGWGTLVATLLFSWVSPGTLVTGLNQQLVLGLFAFSGAVTVAAALALREALVRVREEAAARGEAEAMLKLAEQAGGLGLWEWNIDSYQSTCSSGALV